MRAKLLSLLAATVIGMGAGLLQAEPVQAASKVRVTIPEYSVTINGISVDVKSQYPMINYKGITYVPMTWDFSRAMGLYTEWSEEAGLSVHQGVRTGRITGVIGDRIQGQTAGTTYAAHLVDYAVQVMGERTAPGEEAYPLLAFRDITYFPLTWHYAVDQFGWKLEWEDGRGLDIATQQTRMLRRIVMDDEESLYVESAQTNRYYKVSKSLDAPPVLLSEEESGKIMKKLSEQEEANRSIGIPEGDYQGEGTARDGEGNVSFQGIPLMSLKKIIAENDAYYVQNPSYENKGVFVRDRIIPLGEERYLAGLTVFKLTHIPAPYTPRTEFLFIVDTKEGTAVQAEGFDQYASHVSCTDNRDCWVWSDSVKPDQIRTANAGNRGQLALLSSDGRTTLYNSLLSAADIDVLHADANGELILKAYNNRLAGDAAGEWDGFYRASPGADPVKLRGPETGYSYWSSDHHLYNINWEQGNEIRDLTEGRTGFWWDRDIESGLQ